MKTTKLILGQLVRVSIHVHGSYMAVQCHDIVSTIITPNPVRMQVQKWVEEKMLEFKTQFKVSRWGIFQEHALGVKKIYCPAPVINFHCKISMRNWTWKFLRDLKLLPPQTLPKEPNSRYAFSLTEFPPVRVSGLSGSQIK